jgi:hypothetical protein
MLLILLAVTLETPVAITPTPSVLLANLLGALEMVEEDVEEEVEEDAEDDRDEDEDVVKDEDDDEVLEEEEKADAAT